MKRFFTLTAIALFTCVLHAQQTGYFTTQFSWTNAAGLQNRSLRMHVPASYNPANSYALVIGFHGLGDNPVNYTQVINYYVTNSYFENVIVACPNEGTPNTSWFAGSEDLKIISAIISHLKTSYNIDTTRVFAQGFSFGGKSAYLHGLDEADHLKGIIAHSPGFYSTADVHNTCNDPLHCQHKYNYANAWKLMVCITAGSGEYNLGQTEPYLTLASKAVLKLNSSGGDAIFIEDPTGYHNLPPITIVRSCWDHVNRPSTNINEISDAGGYRVFPNPASCFINIETNHAGITRRAQLLNTTGAVVYQTEFSDYATAIPVHNIAEGLYLLKIYGIKGESLFQSRIVVMH